MIATVKSYLTDLLHLFYPHICLGCGTDALQNDDLICAKCLLELPETGFFSYPDNLVEKKFIGRINIQNAGSAFYFTKDSLLQTLLFDLKYRGNKQSGILLGKLTGFQLLESNRFRDIDAIVPLPLHHKKQRLRGYNQSEVISDSISSILQKPVLDNCVVRTVFTETQTNKDRINRWLNMENAFVVENKHQLEGKHILLVDDVLTTGATLDACGTAMLKIKDIKLSIATVAYRM